jgi:hypothetical protein
MTILVTLLCGRDPSGKNWYPPSIGPNSIRDDPSSDPIQRLGKAISDFDVWHGLGITVDYKPLHGRSYGWQLLILVNGLDEFRRQQRQRLKAQLRKEIKKWEAAQASQGRPALPSWDIL